MSPLGFRAARALARNVADQAIELISDFREVLLGPKAKFLRLDSKLHQVTDMLALRFLDVGHDHHRLLQFLDRGLHLFAAHGCVH